MNSYKKLFNNVLIFSIGVLGSKLISFLLVPLYTHYLSQGEFGTADLVMTTVSMLLPLVTASMYEAVIRFIVNKSYDKDEVLVNAIVISGIGYLILLLLYPVLHFFNVLGNSLPYLYIFLFLQGIHQILAQYTRGIGESKKFAMNGIITTFFNASFNILFLVKFNWGLNGYFLAYILGHIIATLYLIISVRPFKNFNLKKFNKETSLVFLKYSVPLIPNSLMWWLINSSSRYFIIGFINIQANGIFAVASRIPALINIVSQVFSQAWQLSAFEEYGKNDDRKFYSTVFDFYFAILLIATSGVVWVVKPAFGLLFAEGYFTAWMPVPFLVLGTAFSAASGFIGVAYTASHKTSGVFKTSIYGGAISLILNLIFIPTLGIIGAGISSTLSFFAMFIIRYFDTKEILSMKIEWKKIIFTLIIIGIQTSVLFLNANMKIEFMINALLFGCLVINNRSVFTFVSQLITSISKK